MKKALVLGAAGFIGHHLVARLKHEGYFVSGVDIAKCVYEYPGDIFIQTDLRDQAVYPQIFSKHTFDEVYQLAADMGGATYINTGEFDADVMSNSVLINTLTAKSCAKYYVKRVFFSSSACVYNEHNQMNELEPVCTEDSVYPAFPDSEYGWEKLFSERMYTAFTRQYGIQARIARFHNIYGEECVWDGGKEKSPAAICRKIALCSNGGTIDIIGDGKQTRSFLHVQDCIEGIRKLMQSDVSVPVNIGSDVLISIDNLAYLIANKADKAITINHVPGAVGVRGRKSDNTLIYKLLNWQQQISLEEGMEKTYKWINKQIYST